MTNCKRKIDIPIKSSLAFEEVRENAQDSVNSS